MLVVALSLLAGVTHAETTKPTRPAAQTKQTKQPTKQPTKSTKAKATKPTTKKSTASKTKQTRSKRAAKSKGTRVGKKDSRVPTRSTGGNMPRGWSWPPNAAMVSAAKKCQAKLDDLAVTWKPAQRDGHIAAPITTDMTFGGVKYVPVYRKGPFTFDCHLAVALETFGKDLFDLGVREVHFGSIFRWSKVRVGGRTKNMLSRHALGLAMDIVAFVDDTGRVAGIQRDYPKDDVLLLNVEKQVNLSGKFRLLLTPKNDPASHSDHFHLEANPDFRPMPPAPVPASDDVSAQLHDHGNEEPALP